MDSSQAVLSVLFVVVVVVMVSRVALPVIAQMLATTMGLIFIGVVLATEMPVSPARPDPTRYLNFLTPILHWRRVMVYSGTGTSRFRFRNHNY
jgi:hypothetical protein